MINNISKKIFKTIFLILTVIINIEPCLAVVTETTNQASFDGKTDYWIEEEGTYMDGPKKIKYTFKYSIEVNKKITLNMYNMNKESLIPKDIRVNKDIHTFKAGTWAGISVTETQTSDWEIDLKAFKYTEIRKNYFCKYERVRSIPCYGTKQIQSENDPSSVQNGTCSILVWGNPESTYICTFQKPENQCPKVTEYAYQVVNVVYNTNQKICPQTYGKDADFGGKYTLITEQLIQKSDGHGGLEYDKTIIDANGNTVEEGEMKDNTTYYYEVDSKKFPTQVPLESYEGSYGAEVLKKKEVARIKALAKEKLGSSATKVRYIKVNDYDIYENECRDNRTNSDLCYGIIEGISKEGIKENSTVTTKDIIYGGYYIDYDFPEEKVCINAKTSEVTYGRECNGDEIKVENGEVYDEELGRDVTYWHYFIPLNTKSDSDFWLEVIKNEQNTFSKEECISVIKDKPDSYEYYITPLEENKTFIGDYDEFVEKSKSDDIKLLNSIKDGEPACSLSARINIPVSQEFYNETTNNEGIKRFKGFNFYYKPININNPFPNGLSATSLWKEWYDTVKSGQIATPDISKSFNEVTYIATNINAAKVRNYTKNNPYTSWKNISLGGRSSFIENENIITRNEGVSFYKLGCGPYNSDWSECKK